MNSVVMWLIYLTTLGLCCWYGPIVSAVVNSCNAEQEVSNQDFLIGLVLGLTPVLNLFFLLGCSILVTDVRLALYEKKRGNPRAVHQLNAKLREKYGD